MINDLDPSEYRGYKARGLTKGSQAVGVDTGDRRSKDWLLTHASIYKWNTEGGLHGGERGSQVRESHRE